MLKPFISMFLVCLLVFPLVAQDYPDATKLVTTADELLRGQKSSVQEADFIVIRPDRKIERTFLVYLKGPKSEFSLAQFLKPLRDKNVTTLKRNYDLWLYTPSIRKTLRIPTTMMHEGFMGSDFTYDDINKASTLAHDYSHKIIGVSKEYEKDHGKVFVVDLGPLPDRPVTYPKLRLWIRENGSILLRQAYYGEDPETKKLKVLRVMVYDTIKEIGGRVIPNRQTMLVLEKKGYQTIFALLNAEFDKEIDDAVFSMRALTNPPKPRFGEG